MARRSAADCLTIAAWPTPPATPPGPRTGMRRAPSGCTAKAYDIARPGHGVPDYYIALVKGGNHAAVGFRLRDRGRMEEHANQPYILLDADPSRFEVTLLHETGHMAMALLAGGRQMEGETMSGIPHSTAVVKRPQYRLQRGLRDPSGGAGGACFARPGDAAAIPSRKGSVRRRTAAHGGILPPFGGPGHLLAEPGPVPGGPRKQLRLRKRLHRSGLPAGAARKGARFRHPARRRPACCNRRVTTPAFSSSG